MTNNHEVETVAREYFQQVRWLARQVKPGMTRVQVENLFRHSYGGVQGLTLTIYHQARGAKVEVPFDSLGGPCSSQNRVVGEAKIFLEIGEIHGVYNDKNRLKNRLF